MLDTLCSYLFRITSSLLMALSPYALLLALGTSPVNPSDSEHWMDTLSMESSPESSEQDNNESSALATPRRESHPAPKVLAYVSRQIFQFVQREGVSRVVPLRMRLGCPLGTPRGAAVAPLLL